MSSSDLLTSDTCTLTLPSEVPQSYQAPDFTDSPVDLDRDQPSPSFEKSEPQALAPHSEFEMQETVEEEEQADTARAEACEQLALDGDPTLSLEERLIDKLTEFEGKVEALQILKADLYLALEQLDQEQQTSPTNTVEVERPVSPI